MGKHAAEGLLDCKAFREEPNLDFGVGRVDELQLHKQELMKALDDTSVPVGTNNNNVAAMINKDIRGHQINFCDESFPSMGGCTTRL